ncbi:hypothetical protein [Peribacillus sp. S4]
MSEGLLDISMHIPKTRGTTLSAIFRKQFKANEIFGQDSYEFKIKKLIN